MKIETINSFKLFRFEWDYIDSHMYVILEKNEAIIIDPVFTSETVNFFTDNNYINNIIILLTHEHFDHINGVNWLKKQFKTQIYCNKFCFDRIKNPSKNFSDKADVIKMFNANIEKSESIITPFCCEATMYFEHTHTFKWNNHKIEMISTPGHSPGSICIIIDEQYLFSGDTLLEFPTITRLPGGNKNLFFEQTLPFLLTKTKVKKVFPGHGKSGNITEFLEKYK